MKIQLSQITQLIEDFAPKQLQESYDNCGLLVGNNKAEIKGALLCLDVTEEIIDEAIQKKLNLVIAHHPVIFGKVKSITNLDMTGRSIIKAIKNDIAIYAAHTNIDNVKHGVSFKMAEKLDLRNVNTLSPANEKLGKLVTFCPEEHIEPVRKAIFDAGAGWIGNYSETSFNITGTGTFKGEDGTDPFVGKKGERHYEKEIRFETIFPVHLQSQIVKAMVEAHPYEEVAYDVYALKNSTDIYGLGAIGDLEKSLPINEFLQLVKKSFKTGCIRFTQNKKRKIQKVALCGGSGSFLLQRAISLGADAYISADFKYHEFFEGIGDTIILDIGHYESEQFTPEIFRDIILQKFPTFAVQISKISTNPIKYF